MERNLIKTGIEEIDNIWDGFNFGYVYLLISEKEEINREILLKYVNKILNSGQQILYFVSLKSEDFLQKAKEVIPDIDEYVKRNLFFIHFINPEFLKIKDDRKIISALTSLKKILIKEKANQIIIDNFTYFLNFENLEKFYKEIFELFMSLREYSYIGLFSLTKDFIEQNIQIFSFLKEISAGLIFYEENKYHLFSRFSHQERVFKKEEFFIPEFPQSLTDQDSYTGLYNYQGFKQILNNLIEKKINFSLFGYQILTDLADHLKRIFLHRITKILKEKGIKVPAMRYQDKVYLLFLNNQEKIEDCKRIINEEEIAGGIRIANFIYHYPVDFQTGEELEKIL
ncbi:MAG: ATPase domain-containing protein [candidate division WOR-3 bacterium]